MAKIDTLPAISRAEKVSNFLSDITGLPIAAVQAFPELAALAKKKHKSGDSGFNYRLALGNPGDSYEVRVAIDLMKDDWTPGEWLPSTGWQVLHNGREVLKRGTYVDTSTSFRLEDLTDPVKINKYLGQELQAVIGGPNTEIPFMNFDRYTTGSLGNEDSYFATIYLALMADAKERGLPMPPILSKKPEVARPMSLGDTETVDKVLAAAIIFEGSGLDARCQAHMKHEAEVIRSQAKWEHRKRDPAIDLAEVFSDLEMRVIKEGKTTSCHTILVVENDLDHPGDFTEEVVEGLGEDGRYRGARVIREVNLPACMQLCETGKVDMVLFDWSKPSSEEALMVRGNRNSWFDLVNGDAQAVLDLDGDGMKIGLPDGRVLSKDDLPREAEELDIRSRWADMIADACRDSKVEPPPHFIVKSRGEMRDLAKIVSQKLGRTPSQ